MTAYIEFVFNSFYLYLNSQLFDPMVAMIFVFGVFRLTWFLLIGGYNNND